MTSWEFPATDPVDLRVRIPAGCVTVRAAAAQTATVTLETDRPGGGAERFLDATRVEFDQGALSVIVPERSWIGIGRGRSLDVTVEVPTGSSCLAHTASADVRCTGELSALDVHTASGDVSAELVSGVARAATVSGDVYVAQAVEADLQSTSGDVNIGQVTGPARVSTVSGDVRIDAASGSRTEAKSTSGDIRVAVPPGIGVYLDLSTLSGTASSELEPADESGGADMTLNCRTLSGDVQVTRAIQPAAR
jgi:Putative adhesin